MADIWIDVDTALSEVPVNITPLVDAATGATIDDGVTYDEAGMDLNWNFITTTGAYSQTNVVPTTGGTHDWASLGNGMYSIEIPASGGTINNDTEGFGWFTGFCTACLPWRGPVIGFRAATTNDLLIDGTEFQNTLFADGTVWVDPNGTNSTAWPYGSAPYPTSTIANGKTIADALKIQRINITGTISLAAAMENYELIGSGNIDVAELVDINSQSTEHSTFRELTVTGIGGNAAGIGDQTRYTNCLVYAHTNINGVVQGGSLGGACSVADTGYALFTDVFFGQGAACTLTVQAPTKCDIINMRGAVTISGMDGGILNITLTDGSSVTIDNTCTAGTITLTGIGVVTDNSNGSTVVALADTPTVLHAATDALITTAQTDLDELTDAGTLSGVRLALMLDRIYTRLFHEVNVTDASGAAAIRDAGDSSDIATGSITDDDTTTSQAKWTWA
jgi:hypothetical protein